MVSLVSSYKLMTKDETTSLSRVQKQPTIQREIDYYKSKIGDIKTIDDFMKDQRIYNFAMDAFGLSDMKYAKAFMRKALTEGVDSAESFSVKLADSRFMNFVSTFNFKQYGKATTAFDKAQQGVVDKFVQAKFESQAGDQSDGLRLALYFKRNAGNIKSAYSILADKALYTTVRMALGLPAAMSSADIDKQASVITARLNLDDLKDPAKVDKLITRFLARYEMENGSGSGSSVASPALSILGGASSSSGFSESTLLSLQSLRRFGS